MKFIMVLFVIVADMMADSFLGNMYIDLKDLNLTQTQQERLKDIMKNQHEFLKQWYTKAKNNNDRIMQSFSTSSLDKQSVDLNDNINLTTSRLKAEQDFLIAVYEVLDKKQRARLAEKIKEHEKQEERQLFNKIEPKIESSKLDNLFGGKHFRRQNVNNDLGY